MRPFVDGPGTVVVGLDGSASSQRALRYAFDHAGRAGGQVVAVHVPWELTMYDGLGVSHVMTDAETVIELRSDVAAEATTRRVPTLFVTASGDPAMVLRTIARRHLADMIVVAGRRRFISRLVRQPWLMRRRFVCPVVVLP